MAATGDDFLFMFGDEGWLASSTRAPASAPSHVVRGRESGREARLYVRPSPGIHHSGWYGDDQIVLCWWGDWRNQEEIRRLLGASPTSSGELLARAWQKYALSLLPRLRGVVSAIVYTVDSPGPILIRDTMGLSPFLWDRSSKSGLLTSTDPDWLLEARRTKPEPDLETLGRFLYSIDDESQKDFLVGLERLGPHEWLRWQDGRVERGRYWRPQTAYDVEPRPHASIVLESLREILKSSTLPEPKAVAMSGGIDSPVVCALEIERRGREGLIVASMTAPELPRTDESAAVADVAAALSVKPELFPIDDRWPLRDPGVHVEPLAWGPHSSAEDSYGLPFYSMIREQGAQTVMSGVGADQIFSVTPFHYVRRLLRRRIPGRMSTLRAFLTPKEILRHSLATGFDELGLGPAWRERFRAGPFGSLAAGLRKPRPAESLWLDEAWICGDRPQPLFQRPLEPERYLDDADWRLTEIRGQEWEWTCRHLARIARRSGLAHFLPTLDTRLWELALPIPPEVGMAGGHDKFVLRQIACRYMPFSIAFKPKHGGFDAVIERGLAERGRPVIDELFRNSRLAELGLIDETRFRKAIEAYARAQAVDSAHGLGSLPLWRTISAELWLRRLL
jgi:asparagine synthetase B (glutamine-hydrolysing)